MKHVMFKDKGTYFFHKLTGHLEFWFVTNEYQMNILNFIKTTHHPKGPRLNRQSYVSEYY